MFFNNYDFSNDFKILQIRRNLLPPIDHTSKKISGRAGMLLTNTGSDTILSSDIIEVDIEIKTENNGNFMDKIREVSGKLYSNVESKLILPDEPDRYEIAILTDSTPLNKIYKYGRATLRFLRPVPISFGKEMNITIGTGLMPFTGTHRATQVYLSTTFTKTATFIQYREPKTGQFVRIDHLFVANDIVTVDMDRGIVMKNGHKINEDVSFASDYFQLPLEDFKIEVTPTGHTSTIKFRERWL